MYKVYRVIVSSILPSASHRSGGGCLRRQIPLGLRVLPGAVCRFVNVFFLDMISP